jgi:hypothetical protein
VKSLDWIRSDEAKRAAQHRRGGKREQLDPQTPAFWAQVWASDTKDTP